MAYAQDDDLWRPDHLSRMGALMDRAPRVTWAYSRPLWITPEGLALPVLANLQTARVRASFLHLANVVPMTNVVHRRSCLDWAGWWREDGAPNGDWDLWRRIIAVDGPGAIGFVRVPTALHVRSGRRPPGDAWLPRGVAVLDLMARGSPLWPRGLRLDAAEVGDGTPQAATARRLAGEAGPLVSQLRTGTEQLADILAWDGLAGGLC